MIRTNIATRPFYNERTVHLLLLVVGVLAVAATVFNLTRVLQLSQRDTRLMSQASRDESASVDVRARAARIRATVDPRALETAAADAKHANELIDRRTFSWTELFNRLGATLPDTVRITAVRPKLDPKRGMVLTLIAETQNTNFEDVNLFIDKLQMTGAFSELQKLSEVVDEDNKLLATLEALYTPSTARPAEGGDR
jgi:hypothetical protein